MTFLLDHSLQGFLLIEGQSLVVRYANTAFCELVRRPRSEVEGSRFRDVLPCAASEDCLRRTSRVAREGVSQSHSIEVNVPGALVPLTWELQLSPVDGSATSARHVLVQIMDMTESIEFREQMVRINEKLIVSSIAQQELAEKAEKLNAELGRALSVRDDFIAIASHELRTPLTSLDLQQQLLELTLESVQGDVISKDIVRKALDITNRQIQKLARLVESMLDLSRINQGLLRTRIEDVDLGALVSDLIAGMSNEITSARTTVDLIVEGKVTGRWDASRVEQVCVNLLTNALKYGERRPVIVRVTRQGANAQVSVRDSGLGIAEVDHERIFQRFERAVSYKHISGLGIGLFIAREIAEAYGGSITVKSEPGCGATFTFEIPLFAARNVTDLGDEQTG